MTSKPYPSRVADQFVVRMPDGMRERLAEAAKAAGRSMNNEIVDRIQQSFQGYANENDIEALMERVRELEAERDRAIEAGKQQATHAMMVAGVARALVDHLSADQLAHPNVKLANDFFSAVLHFEADRMASSIRRAFGPDVAQQGAAVNDQPAFFSDEVKPVVIDKPVASSSTHAQMLGRGKRSGEDGAVDLLEQFRQEAAAKADPLGLGPAPAPTGRAPARRSAAKKVSHK